MIVSFSVSNFRSFASEQTLSMVASERLSAKHVNHTLPIPDSDERVLRVGVLYGANAAGKSNLFKAIKYLKTRALRPRKKNTGTQREPFRFSKIEEEPSSFDLRFIANGKLYGFGCKASDEQIVEEWLVRVEGKKERVLYERITNADGNVSIEAKGLKGQNSKIDALATVGGPQNQTFLATVRATLSATDYGEDLSAVINWFEKSLFLVAPTATFGGLGHRLSKDNDFRDFVSAFLKEASTGIQKLEVNKKELSEEDLRSLLPPEVVKDALGDLEDGESTLIGMGDKEVFIERSSENHYSVLTIGALHDLPSGKSISLDITDESDGTQRLLNLIPTLHQLRHEGGVYIIDEIDRSLHPLLAIKFIEFFLKTCEGDQRQVFVTTHESNLLDLELLRRDEFWFAEKDSAGATHLYSLSDFKVRTDLEVRKHYLQGRFGAIPFLGNLDQLLVKENKIVLSNS